MNHYLNQAPGSRLRDKDHELLYFAGTSYLGLQTDPEFQDILIKNIRILGTNWGASRKSNIRLSVYRDFEKYIAQKAGAQESMAVSSGYMAGQMLARYFSEKGYTLMCAPNTHPALIHENSVLFQNYEDLNKSIRSTTHDKVVLFMDTIDFSGTNYPDFKFLKNLPLENIILVADDSHGLGLIGENGFGIFSLLQEIPAMEIIVCGSLGKALATGSGIVLGKESRIDELRDLEFFAGASPPSPAALKTLMEAERITDEKRKNLRRNIRLFLGSVTSDFDIITMDHHPVIGYNNEDLTDFLLEKGIVTTNFRYPSETSPLVSKIVLNADHSQQDILHLTQTINSFFEKK